MTQSNIDNLRVLRTAEQLADDVWQTVRTWDRFERQTVGLQFVRAADSVGANIAEGAGRATYRDNRRCVAIARGSLFEAKYWLRRAHARGLLTPDQTRTLRPVLSKHLPTLNAYRRSIGSVRAVSSTVAERTSSATEDTRPRTDC
jgi:four helix bundle protein